ncbi:hypothetical protein GCM10009839_58700 [Catenulispora yoronensis]|uniref:Uncharacterized protein n=1 Tax=Catenulispora yoronensis TaxID=450799 RepID=A0ABP5GK59_9ACTN
MSAPTWYHDGVLSLLRRQMQDAQWKLAEVEGDTPPGPVTSAVTSGREAAWNAEVAFATRVLELQAEDAAKRLTAE